MEDQLATFAEKLQELMQGKHLTASDLARGLWGTTTDSRGYEGARNRDTVSRWLRGALPNRENAERIAKFFDVPVDALGIDQSRSEKPEMTLEVISEMMLLQRDEIRVLRDLLLHLVAELRRTGTKRETSE